jgi:hypothetical protein
MAVTTTSRDGIAVITFDNPPVNGMGLAVRRGIADAIAAANADDAIAGIVITGGGKVFSGGADIKEFNTPRAEQAPNLHDVIAAVEASPKPVCIAINGTALGGGMELSLGANYRVAHAKAEVGLPEVKIGILPGAGGSGRDRRRHHGRRHRHELPERRHPREDAGDEAGGAGPGWPPSARTTKPRSRRASSSRTSTSSAWPAQHHAELRRPQDADLVIEAVFEDMGVKEAVFKKLDR